LKEVTGLESKLDALAAETQFSGVVRVDEADQVIVAKAYGFANRAYEIRNELDTQFAIASGTKGFTALAVVSLIEEHVLELSTTARSLLGGDLPLIGNGVTVELLLSHRSGIGDYLDEDVSGYDVDDYVLPISAHELATTVDYLPVLDGRPPKFSPGRRFAYCNSGYVLLALIAERASGVAFHELVRQRVCEPAGMGDTAFLRSDELPGRAAVGYVGDGRRTNVFHLPVRGNGDGGIYTTAADVSAFWEALLDGRIVSTGWVAKMLRPRSDVPEHHPPARYGLGFWLDATRDIASLEGGDAGVGFTTVHDPRRRVTCTVIANALEGASAVMRLLVERVLD